MRFRLREADATFLSNLAQAFDGILSAEYAERLAVSNEEDEPARSPIGTGPFCFAGDRADVAVRYRGFPDYWRKPEGAATNAPVDLDAVRADPDLALLPGEELNVAYLALNTTRPPMDDVRVRRAINLAIDRRAIVEAVYGGANLARWCDPAYNAHIQAARRTDDRETRTRLYRAAQGRFREALPWVPLAHTVVHMAAHRRGLPHGPARPLPVRGRNALGSPMIGACGVLRVGRGHRAGRTIQYFIHRHVRMDASPALWVVPACAARQMTVPVCCTCEIWPVRCSRRCGGLGRIGFGLGCVMSERASEFGREVS